MYVISESVDTRNNSSLKPKLCTVCDKAANGHYFGAIVCLPCKSFFIRCTKDGEPVFTGKCDGKCVISKDSRIKCSQCRFKRCLNSGMKRNSKPACLLPRNGQFLCKVCGDLANGIHFGVHTCEGCKKFFRRCLLENCTLVCKGHRLCPIDLKNRNNCRLCRYLKCLTVGMSRSAIKMGRPRKYSRFPIRGITSSSTDSHDRLVDELLEKTAAPDSATDIGQHCPQALFYGEVNNKNRTNMQKYNSRQNNESFVDRPAFFQAQELQPSHRSKSLGNIYNCTSGINHQPWTLPTTESHALYRHNFWDYVHEDGNYTNLYKSPDFMSMPDLRQCSYKQTSSSMNTHNCAEQFAFKNSPMDNTLTPSYENIYDRDRSLDSFYQLQAASVAENISPRRIIGVDMRTGASSCNQEPQQAVLNNYMYKECLHLQTNMSPDPQLGVNQSFHYTSKDISGSAKKCDYEAIHYTRNVVSPKLSYQTDFASYLPSTDSTNQTIRCTDYLDFNLDEWSWSL